MHSTSEIAPTGAAQFGAWQGRIMPPVERIAGGIWSIPVPIPDNPLRYTLSYAIPGRGGVVVVDPGWQSDNGWQVLLDGLGAAGFTVTDVAGIVVTHVHPDHHGLSGVLREASGAWVAMHPEERNSLPRRLGLAPVEGSHGRAARLLAVAGAPDDEVVALLARFDRPGAARVEDLIEPDRLLEDGDRVQLPGRRLQVLWTPGHTPGHICLREPDARVLLTGDHILPRITPNIGLRPDAVGAPLERYLASLETIAQYDDHEVLPAHEYRFSGLAARAQRLREHHQQRCDEILTVVGGLGAPTLWELAENLTWSRSWSDIAHMRIGALAETAAHASHLVDDGTLAWTSDGGLSGPEQPVRMRLAV